MTTQFRIGGVYRDNGGGIVRLIECGHMPAFLASDYEGTTAARAEYIYGTGYGWRRLDNGRLGSARHNPKARYHLVPGEIHRVGGEWVPLHTTSLGFPSGSQVLTNGDKIVGRVDPAPEPVREPLPHFNQQTKHDPFGDGFIVTKGSVEVIPTQPSPSKDPYPAIAGLLKTA